MRIVLDDVDIPATVMEGYETTGEARLVQAGELYLYDNFGEWGIKQWRSSPVSNSCYIIVRKVKPEIWMPEDGDHYQFVMLVDSTWHDASGNTRHIKTGNRFKPGAADLDLAIDAIRSDIDERTK